MYYQACYAIKYTFQQYAAFTRFFLLLGFFLVFFFFFQIFIQTLCHIGRNVELQCIWLPRYGEMKNEKGSGKINKRHFVLIVYKIIYKIIVSEVVNISQSRIFCIQLQMFQQLAPKTVSTLISNKSEQIQMELKSKTSTKLSTLFLLTFMKM